MAKRKAKQSNGVGCLVLIVLVIVIALAIQSYGKQNRDARATGQPTRTVRAAATVVRTQVVRPTATRQPVQAQSGSRSSGRPGNCSTAVAMGLSDTQAGQWSHLDRDGDHVACYGD